MNYRLIFLAIALLPLAPSVALASDDLYSPSRRFVVEFSTLPKSDFQFPGFDPTRHHFFRYLVKIRNASGGQPSEAKYNDVRDFAESKSEDLAHLVQRFIWSPNEDFMMFPEEDWPSSPASPARQALNLRKDFAWSTATVHMELDKWMTPLVVAGNAKLDCNYTVNVFDGRSGKLTSIRRPESPIGFEFVSASSTTVTIRSMLDNCQHYEDLAVFVPKCEIFDISTFVGVPIACHK